MEPTAPHSLSLTDAVAQFSFTVHELLERRAGEHDASFVVTRLMGILRDRTPTIKELATLLELDKSSVTGLVDRAARRGLVQRVPSQTDRRSVHVAPTAEGRRLAAAVASTFGTDVHDLLDGLSDEDRDALTRILTAVLTRHAAQNGIVAELTHRA